MGQTLSAGSVGAASQWHHLRAGWAAPLPVSPCASLCSLCCSAVAREAGTGQAAHPHHWVACERRGVFLSDAAERGRGATSTTPSSKSVAVESRRPRPRGAALVLRAVLRHGRARVWGFVFARVALQETSPREEWFCFRFKPCCLFGCAYYAIVALATSRRNFTAFEKPEPEPIENQRQRLQRQPCREAAPARSHQRGRALAVVRTPQKSSPAGTA